MQFGFQGWFGSHVRFGFQVRFGSRGLLLHAVCRSMQFRQWWPKSWQNIKTGMVTKIVAMSAVNLRIGSFRTEFRCKCFCGDDFFKIGDPRGINAEIVMRIVAVRAVNFSIGHFCTEIRCETFCDDGISQNSLKILRKSIDFENLAGSCRVGSAVRVGSEVRAGSAVRAGSVCVSLVDCVGSVCASSVVAVPVWFMAAA